MFVGICCGAKKKWGRLSILITFTKAPITGYIKTKMNFAFCNISTRFSKVSRIEHRAAVAECNLKNMSARINFDPNSSAVSIGI